MKKVISNFILKLVLIILVIAIDQITKHFLFGTNFILIPYILGIREVSRLNTGGAWGFLSDNMWVLIVITILFLLAVLVFEIKFKNTHLLYTFSLSFIVGGAIGNFIDRLILKGVRDFLYFPFFSSFPTFNVADSFLCIGCILLLIYTLFFYKKEDKSKNDFKVQ